MRLDGLARIFGKFLANSFFERIPENVESPNDRINTVSPTAHSAFHYRRYKNNSGCLREFALAVSLMRCGDDHPAKIHGGRTGSMHSSRFFLGLQPTCPALVLQHVDTLSMPSLHDVPSSLSVPNCYSIPIAQRVRRNRQCLPSSTGRKCRTLAEVDCLPCGQRGASRKAISHDTAHAGPRGCPERIACAKRDTMKVYEWSKLLEILSTFDPFCLVKTRIKSVGLPLHWSNRS